MGDDGEHQQRWAGSMSSRSYAKASRFLSRGICQPSHVTVHQPSPSPARNLLFSPSYTAGAEEISSSQTRTPLRLQSSLLPPQRAAAGCVRLPPRSEVRLRFRPPNLHTYTTTFLDPPPPPPPPAASYSLSGWAFGRYLARIVDGIGWP
ncbi:hypothetical protein PVAP13_2NG523046 [Panicum virgatum]|uniref:Uncharacterized protein n=1 Tax=Panicum virgatum TaxID=38727 RepID=A0A8T0V6S5_PANVG|nr:hypothetical protein PVAP13_2NG523046 [Panicum virgatum]